MQRLAERIIALSKLASKDATRHYLNGVWLSCPKEGEMLLDVTDGVKASRETLDSEGIYFQGNFFIETDQVKLIKAAMGKFNNCVEYDAAKDELVFNRMVSIPRKPDMKPPKFKEFYVLNNEDETRTIPVNDSGSGTMEVPKYLKVGLNAELLADIQKALREGKTGNVCLILDTENPGTKPITVKVGERHAVLMPCRV